MTHFFFGHTLSEPFLPVVGPIEIGDPFFPPPFDIARETPQQWVTKAKQEFNKHCDGIAQQISQWRGSLIASGKLKEL